MPFQIIKGNIVNIRADAIVNTANPEVAIGSGTDHAIYAAAGADRLLEERAKIGVLLPGEVGVTHAYKLRARYIFHVSGPVWEGGAYGERAILSQCYRRCLRLAEEKGCRSIAFPLLAAGTYGFPRAEALRIAVEEFSLFLKEKEIDICLVLMNKEAYALSEEYFPEVARYVDENYRDEEPERGTTHASRRRIFSTTYPSGEFVAESREERISRLERAGRKERNRRAERAGKLSQSGREPRAEQSILKEEADAVYPSMAPMASESVDDYIKQREDMAFPSYLQQLINRKGLTNAEVYKRANLDKKYFSKLMSGKIQPAKLKLLALAVALQLNMDETRDFLRFAGYALTPASRSDLVFEYFIRNGKYDIIDIDIALFDLGLPTVAPE